MQHVMLLKCMHVRLLFIGAFCRKAADPKFLQRWEQNRIETDGFLIFDVFLFSTEISCF